MLKLFLSILLIFGVFDATAEYRLSFVEGNSTVDGAPNEMAMRIHIGTDGEASVVGSSADARFSSWIALEDDDFLLNDLSLTMHAGFGFDVDRPSFDSEPFEDQEKSTLRFRYNAGMADGIAPLGQGVGFNADADGLSEVLYFTVDGLSAGQIFKLTGYSLKDRSCDRINLVYGTPCMTLNTVSAVMDVADQDIALGNGDHFGFVYNHFTGSRSALQEIRFEIMTTGFSTLGIVD